MSEIGKSSKTHGLSKHPIYGAFINMLKRCNNPDDPEYQHYGGRGISVCDRWNGKDKFMTFYEDMSPSWEEGLWLERIDPNQNYTLENCCWESRSGQEHNKRKLGGCSSKYKGVSWNKLMGKWEAYINKNGKRIRLGYFLSETDAAHAYDSKAEELYGYRMNEKLGLLGGDNG